jgi:hypothetical protein
MRSILRTTGIIFLSSGLLSLTHSCEESHILQDGAETDSHITKALATFKSAPAISEQTIAITDCYLGDWQKFISSGATGTITFVNAPDPPLAGKGSLRFYCPDQKPIRLNNDHFKGTRLSDITSLAYSTYVEQSGSLSDNTFIVIQVDVTGDGNVDFPLVFNPVFQTGSYVTDIAPDQGITRMNTWQTWNMLTGVWWKGPSPDPWNGGSLFTLASIIAQYPDATITNQGGGSGAIRIGGGAPYFTGIFTAYTDNFKIGINGVNQTFDFEATTADAGPDQSVVYGYGSNCTELAGIANGGVGPYTYSWSPGGSTPDEATTEVCPSTTTTYTLTVTDANGCSRTDDVTVFVNDVRCGNNLDKVIVCHKGKAICIFAGDVPSHLAHGDFLGNCTYSR